MNLWEKGRLDLGVERNRGPELDLILGKGIVVTCGCSRGYCEDEGGFNVGLNALLRGASWKAV